MKPDSLPDEAVETVSTAAQIAGKTARMLFNGLSLLKNPPEIRTAIVPPLSGLNRTEGMGTHTTSRAGEKQPLRYC